jgi:hypothetical protein
MATASPATADHKITTASGIESAPTTLRQERTDPSPILSIVREAEVSGSGSGRIWHAVPQVRTGTGAEADPWGINQLITPDGKPGVALDAMRPGDTLQLAGGTYDFATEALANSSYNYGVLVPAATDCTIRSKPGEKAVLRRTAGLCPLAGSLRRDGFIAHRTRFLGLELVDATSPIQNPPLVRFIGAKTSTSTTHADGCELAYCRVIAGDNTGTSVIADNHECVRLDYASNAWVHHNDLRGARRTLDDGRASWNASAFKVYYSSFLFEDNWVHDNSTAAYLKTGIISGVFRRNHVAGNDVPVMGTDYHDCGPIEIYDNFIDTNGYNSGAIRSGDIGRSYSIHHNLLIGEKGFYHVKDSSYDHCFWNNILISPGNTSYPYYSPYTTWPGSPPALLEFDYNLVVSDAGGTPNPRYYHQSGNYTLAQFQAFGMEQHSQFVAGGRAAIFDDPAAYTIKAAYRTAGRDADMIGPRSMAAVLALTGTTARDTGPEALIALESAGASVDRLVLSGPSSGVVARPSAPFTLALGSGTLSGSVRVTPSDAAAGGVFNPGFVDLTDSVRAVEFTYTPASGGARTISTTNDRGLMNPPPLAFVATASAYAWTGPASGRAGAASGPFTVTPNGSYTGTVTPNDGGAGGTFRPAVLSWSGDATPQSFTYTPTTGGPRALAFSNSADLADPAPHWYTATASSFALAGPMPSASACRAASDFTVTPDGPYTGTVTPNDGGAGGTFRPAVLSWSGDATPQSFTYTPATTGPKTIALRNDGGLIDPAPISYSVADYTYTLSGPTAGVAGAAAGPFTITPLLPLIGSVVLDDNGAGGTFRPAVLNWNGETTPRTFTYTPAAAGSWTITTTNTGGFLDPAPRAIAVRTPGTFVTTYRATSWSDPYSWQRDPGPIPDDWDGVRPPPGDGDRVVITYPITLDTAVTVGTGAASGVALRIGANLTIADGAALTLRGHVVQRSGVTVTGQGAGSIRFDSSRTTPAETSYTWQIADAASGGTLPWPMVVIRGRAGARFRVESAPGGGAGRFTSGGQAGGGMIDAEYCDFIRIGDATADAFQPRVDGGGILRLDHCTLRQCGRVAVDQGLGATASLVLNASTWTQPAAALLVTLPYLSADRTTGTWQVTNCDFVGPVQLRSRTFTISGNTHRAAWTLDGMSRPADAGPFRPSALALSGPATGAVGAASGPFTVQLLPDGSKAPGMMITPTDGGAGGTFTPGSVALSETSGSVTFTYTPATAGPRSIGVTTDGVVPGGNGPLAAAPAAFLATVPAAGYVLTTSRPATGLAGVASAPMVVALPAGTTVARAVRITPNDGGAGGTFVPSSVVLDTADTSASFTYVPAGAVGPRMISTTNDGGLADPPPIEFAVETAATSYTLTGPAAGEVGRESGAFVVTLGPGALAGTVRVTPAASNGDGTFAPPFVELSAKRRSASFVYVPSRWSVRTITTTNSGGLANPPGLAFVAKVQTGRSGHDPSGNRGPDLGGCDLFGRGAWWRELGRDITNDPVDPSSDLYISRMAGLTVHVEGSTTTANGGDSTKGLPYNVVSGATPRVPLTVTMDPSGSDPGPVPWPPDITLESYASPTHTPAPSDQTTGTAQRAIVYRRDEATGGLAELWEFQAAFSEDAGATWKAHGGARFDLAAGALRRAGWTSGDAAGLPIAPLTVRYDEVARGALQHPIRVTFSGWRKGQPMLRNNYLWPARHASSAGSSQDGLPFGARLRLKQSWYEANKDGFTGVPRIILDAMRRYGLIVADVGGDFSISVTQDERWAMTGAEGLLNLAMIPATAFEVVKLRPEVALSGPAEGETGAVASFTIAHQVPDDDNFKTTVAVLWTSDVGLPEANRTWRSTGLSPTTVTLHPANRSATVQFTPPAAGAYLVRITSGDDWLPPPPASFTAKDADTAPVSLQLTPPNPASGVVGKTSNPFTVSLPTGATLGTAVTIIPSDGGTGGWFQPTAVVLDNVNRSAGFSYVPATVGTKQITVANNGGLINPPPVTYVVEPSRPWPRMLVTSPEMRPARQPWRKTGP